MTLADILLVWALMALLYTIFSIDLPRYLHIYVYTDITAIDVNVLTTSRFSGGRR